MTRDGDPIKSAIGSLRRAETVCAVRRPAAGCVATGSAGLGVATPTTLGRLSAARGDSPGIAKNGVGCGWFSTHLPDSGTLLLTVPTRLQ